MNATDFLNASSSGSGVAAPAPSSWLDSLPSFASITQGITGAIGAVTAFNTMQDTARLNRAAIDLKIAQAKNQLAQTGSYNMAPIIVNPVAQPVTPQSTLPALPVVDTGAGVYTPSSVTTGSTAGATATPSSNTMILVLGAVLVGGFLLLKGKK